MNHTRSLDKKTGLLVSVRDAAEARIAVSSQCVSIIDLKEPENGSLGCASVRTAADVLNCLPDGAVRSIALGEAVDWPVWRDADMEGSDVRQSILSQFDFAKIGLSGMARDPGWAGRWKDCLAELPENVAPVAVAYADADRAGSPPVESILELAAEVGCRVFLIDTFHKGNGGLLDLFSLQALVKIVQAAKGDGLRVVLAGSLDHESIATICDANPDFIGVRGAVCGEDRTTKIEREKIVAIGNLVNTDC